MTVSNNKKRTTLRETVSWLIWLGCAVLLALLIRNYLFTLVIVDGSSMENTLHDGDVMAVSILSYTISVPRRGDVVVCRYPNDSAHYVKRIVALPGEVISIHDNTVFVNGLALAEPYIAEPLNADFPEETVPEGHYFVIGDNRNHSKDSRSVGPIAKEVMLGRAVAVAWPPASLQIMRNAVSFASGQEDSP